MTDPHFFGRDNWFYKKYRASLFCNKNTEQDRYNTMKLAINWFLSHKGRVIVETGCQRLESDWGAGCSTTIFADLVKELGVEFTSIDNDPRNIDFARSVAGTKTVKFIVSDSVNALGRFVQPIDFLYLDSFDYPYGTILEGFGGRENLDQAIVVAASHSEEAIVERFRDVITPCQQHALNEFRAIRRFGPNPVVVVDDAGLPGGGKARLIKSHLLQIGWIILLEDYQLVMVRP